jgi:hypothetical protein
MKSNYKPLGKYIQVVGRNNDLGDLPLVGLSIQKSLFLLLPTLLERICQYTESLKKISLLCPVHIKETEIKLPLHYSMILTKHYFSCIYSF